MKPIEHLTNQTLRRIATDSSPVESKPEGPTQFSSLSDRTPSARLRPLKTLWQQKWLDMEMTHPDVQAMADRAQAFCGGWYSGREDNRLLVLCGVPGCGKTHVARRVAGWGQSVAFQKYLDKRSASSAIEEVRFVEWSHIASPERMPEREFLQWLGEIDGIGILVIDDIGAESDQYRTGIPAMRLCEVLNRRAGKWTLMTTNLHPSEWSERWDARVSDRLLRNSEVLALEAASFVTAKAITDMKHETGMKI